MSKRLKPSGVTYWRLEANREENLTKYAGSINAYLKKSEQNRQSNDEKDVDKQKKQDWSTMKNKIYFSLWVFDFDVHDTLLFLISLIDAKNDLRPIWIL